MDDLGDLDYGALMRTFLIESEDHLREMEEALITLESSPGDEETLNTIFRTAHTIKGSSSCLGLQKITDFAHILEDRLDSLREGTVPITGRIITLLLEAVDVLRQMFAAVESGEDSDQPARETLVERFAQEVSEAIDRANGVQRESVAVSAAELVVEFNHTSGAGRKQDDTHSSHDHSRTLRVDIDRLDRLLDLTSEISIARGRLRQMIEEIGGHAGKEILETHQEADQLYMDLQELVMKVRMIPVGPVFRQYIRMVRDLAEANGKVATLMVEGADAEVDTTVIDHLRDPLTHMIRNALDHGIETPDVRIANGKDPCGCITLRAYHDSGNIIIQVVDDGEGLNRERIAERARSRGLASEPEKLTDQEIWSLIFEPGFSTAESVTEFSGRGVGMDVVRRNIEALRGSVSVDSRQGEGATITIRLPLTLAIIDGLRVEVGSDTYVIPLEKVVECVELSEDERRKGSGSGAISLRGTLLPYLNLRNRFAPDSPAADKQNVVVVQYEGKLAGLAVDALHGEGQAVIKPMGKLFNGLPGIAGSTILGNGRVALILDVQTLLREATQMNAPTL